MVVYQAPVDTLRAVFGWPVPKKSANDSESSAGISLSTLHLWSVRHVSLLCITRRVL